jgi:GntR family transcriptional regulator
MPLKFEDLAERLRKAIADDEYPLGSALPSSRELAAKWEVSRETAVRALELLKADALVESRQGARHTVIATPLARPAGSRAASSTRTDGALPFTRLGMPRLTTPPQAVASALRLGDEDQALQRVRLLHLPDGTPQSLVTAWFPRWIAEAAPKLADLEAIAEGTTRYVRRCTGATPHEGEDDESLRELTEWEADVLGATAGEVGHVLLHTARDSQGRVLVVEEGVTLRSIWRRVSHYSMVGSS